MRVMGLRHRGFFTTVSDTLDWAAAVVALTISDPDVVVGARKA
jgi:hypothetical protein